MATKVGHQLAAQHGKRMRLTGLEVAAHLRSVASGSNGVCAERSHRGQPRTCPPRTRRSQGAPCTQAQGDQPKLLGPVPGGETQVPVVT
jgi:hypothetical protein